MKNSRFQTGIGLAGLVTVLLAFAAISFGVGWLANKYYANRLSLKSDSTLDFPYLIQVDTRPGGMTWNGQQLIFTNRNSPWGVVRITPLTNGQYRKTSIPVVDSQFKQQLSLQGISWNGTTYVALTSGDAFQSGYKKVFVELDPDTFQATRVLAKAPDNAQCIAWDGINYWAGTRLQTADQKGRSVLYKFNDELKLLSEYEGAGTGCQGMAWDGKFLWWADVFDDTLSLFNITHSTTKSPTLVHQYQSSINQQSGITFDGINIWVGDFRNEQLKRLNQKLYFDWLGNRFDVNNPGQLMLLDRFGKYQSGNTGLDELIQPLLDGKIKIQDIAGYVETLKTRHNTEEVRAVLISVRSKVTDPSITSILDEELSKLVDVGSIDFEDNSPIPENSIKLRYFRGEIEDGDLVASWKIVAGSEILSGIDAPRPQQIPADFDFYTFIQYKVRVTGSDPSVDQEFEYDYFGDEDIREGIVLIEGIIPGKYSIQIDTNAQYYSETKANSYNGAMELKIIY